MKESHTRKNIILVCFVLCGLVLIGKTAQLQILDSKYRDQARKATLQNTTIYPSRGLIYDRNDKLLVTNIPLYDIQVIHKNMDPNMDTTLFCQLLDVTKEEFVQNINKDWKSGQYHKSVAFTFLTKIKPEQLAKFQEHMHKFPGFTPVLKNIRTYPFANAAHILGYLGEVNKNFIQNSQGKYAVGDYTGISGLEKAYEDELKGRKGIRYELKDKMGRYVGAYEEGRLDSMASSGFDLKTTIDIDLQAYGEKLLQNKRGSIVAIEPSTGEILAMVSSPGYDPNELRLDRNRGAAFQKLLHDPQKPFLDRSVMALYPPGSIFKTIMSLISMELGIADKDRYIPCNGYYALDSRGKSVQKCHLHPPASNVGLALQYSCNTYYYQLMRELTNAYGYRNPQRGLDTLVSYLRDFGLGVKLGVDNSYENPGLVPNGAFYDRLYRGIRSGWRATYILSMGIGQGELQVTTLQMANLAAILANRGSYFTPHLVKDFLRANQKIDKAYTSPRKVRIHKKYFEPVIDGMERAVLGGTAQSAYIPGIQVCGKTGTSQNPHGKDHSVFFAFAPKYNPKIAIAVFVENAGWGASYATPIASLMMEKYLNGFIAPERAYKEQKMLNTNLLDEIEDEL